jgi:hypothetical protein
VTADGTRGQVLAALPPDVAAVAAAAARDWRTSSARQQVSPARVAGDVSAATHRAYLADWDAFGGWCAARETAVPPAHPRDIAIYLAAAVCTGRYRPATILRWASSIGAVHASLGHADPCAQSPAREVIAAIRGLPHEPGQHARPLLGDDILAMTANMPPRSWPTEPARRRNRLIVALGAAAALSPARLTGLTLADVGTALDQHALILDTGNVPVLVNPAGAPPACAACAFASWRELVDAADTAGTPGARRAAERGPEPLGHAEAVPGRVSGGRAALPLLRRIRRGGTITADPLTPQVITQIVRDLAARAGLDPAQVSGLSLRAAGRLERMLSDASAARP